MTGDLNFDLDADFKMDFEDFNFQLSDDSNFTFDFNEELNVIPNPYLEFDDDLNLVPNVNDGQGGNQQANPAQDLMVQNLLQQ